MQFSVVLLAAFTACVVSAQMISSETSSMPEKTVSTTATGAQQNVEATAPANATTVKTSVTEKTSTTARSSSKAISTATTTKGSGNGSATNTSTGAPLKVTGNAAAPQLLAQGGGLVTVAGLGVMFAVFM